MLYSAEPCSARLFWLALRSDLLTLPLASRPTSGFQRSEFNMAQALSFAVAARPVSASRLQVRRAEATAAAVSHHAWEPFLPLPHKLQPPGLTADLRGRDASARHQAPP